MFKINDPRTLLVDRAKGKFLILQKVPHISDTQKIPKKGVADSTPYDSPMIRQSKTHRKIRIMVI